MQMCLIYINRDMKLTLWTSKYERPAGRRPIKYGTCTSFLFGCHTHQEQSMWFSKEGTLQVQDEHMWPLNIYRDSKKAIQREKEREREKRCGGKLTANYNIILFDSNIDEPLGSKQTSHKELGNYLGTIDFTVKCFPCVFGLLRGLATSALELAVLASSRTLK